MPRGQTMGPGVSQPLEHRGREGGQSSCVHHPHGAHGPEAPNGAQGCAQGTSQAPMGGPTVLPTCTRNPLQESGSRVSPVGERRPGCGSKWSPPHDGSRRGGEAGGGAGGRGCVQLTGGSRAQAFPELERGGVMRGAAGPRVHGGQRNVGELGDALALDDVGRQVCSPGRAASPCSCRPPTPSPNNSGNVSVREHGLGSPLPQPSPPPHTCMKAASSRDVLQGKPTSSWACAWDTPRWGKASRVAVAAAVVVLQGQTSNRQSLSGGCGWSSGNRGLMRGLQPRSRGSRVNKGLATLCKQGGVGWDGRHRRRGAGGSEANGWQVDGGRW
jgi:hypothetical protein